MGLNLGKIGGFFKKVGLPLLANAIPGGGVVKDLVEGALGVSLDDESAVEAKLQDPATILELKRIETTHEQALVNAALEREKLDQQDRADARARDVAMIQAGKHNYRADILAYGSTAGFLAFGIVLVFANIPETAEKILIYMAGALNALVGMVFTFEFGSSKSSRGKDDVIAGIVARQSTPPVS